MEFTSLNATAWNTANRSGAVGYMSYSEVEKYTELCDLQGVYLDIQRQALAPMTEIGGIMPTILSKDLKRVSEQSLEDIERITNRALIIERTLGDAAKHLSQEYGKFGVTGN